MSGKKEKTGKNHKDKSAKNQVASAEHDGKELLSSDKPPEKRKKISKKAYM